MAIAGEPVAAAILEIDCATFAACIVARDEDLDGFEVFAQHVNRALNAGDIEFSFGHRVSSERGPAAVLFAFNGLSPELLLQSGERL